MSYTFDTGRIVGPSGEVPYEEAADLVRVLASEAISLLKWGRLETAGRFARSALSLHAAWQEAKADRADMAAARALLRGLDADRPRSHRLKPEGKR